MIPQNPSIVIYSMQQLSLQTSYIDIRWISHTKSLLTKLKIQLTTARMGTFSYKFEIFFNLILKFYICQNSHIPNCFEIVKSKSSLFFKLTFILALIKALQSSLLTSISPAMVAKLVDCDYNILTFVCNLLLDVPSLEIGTKLDDGIGDWVNME